MYGIPTVESESVCPRPTIEETAAKVVAILGLAAIIVVGPTIGDRWLLLGGLSIAATLILTVYAIGRRRRPCVASMLAAVVDLGSTVVLAFFVPNAWSAAALIATLSLALYAARVPRGSFFGLVAVTFALMAASGAYVDAEWPVTLAVGVVMTGAVWLGADRFRDDLRNQLEQLRVVTDSVDAVVWQAGHDGRIERIHGPIDRLTGLGHQDFVGRLPDEMPFAESTTEIDAGSTEDAARHERYLRLERDDSDAWFREVHTKPVGSGGRTFGVMLDVTPLIEAQRRERYRADHDPRTGALSRTAFVAAASAALRESDTPKALTVIRLRGIEQISALLGRESAEAAVLTQLRRLRACFPGDEHIGRIADNELAVLSSVATGEDAKRLGDSLMDELSAIVSIDGAQLDTVPDLRSIMASVSDQCAETLLRLADCSMRTGSGDAVLSANEQLRLDPRVLQQDLESLIEIWYQPIVDTITGSVAGFEALTRYRPYDDPVPTPHVLDVLAAFGLMERLDFHVAATAIADTALLRNQGYPVTMSINVSQRGLSNPEYAAHVRAECALVGLDPAHLVFEVSERDLAPNLDLVAETLQALSDMGAQISLDDFGTGHSTLIQIRNMPVDEIKIDRSFVSEILTNRTDNIIVDSIVGLARQLGVRVVAEGVEDQVALDRLERMGVDLVQGFFYAPAQPLRDSIRLANLTLGPMQLVS